MPSRHAFLLVALPALLLVGGLRSGVAKDDDYFREYDDEMLGPHVSSGKEIDAKELPGWWMPLFSPSPVSYLDGHFAGVAVRLPHGYFLAHKTAMERIDNVSKVSRKQGGLFQHQPQTVIDLYNPLPRDDIYEPSLIALYEDEIGLYRTVIRRTASPESRPIDEKFPLKTSPCLQGNKTNKSRWCRFITYSDDHSHGFDGLNGTRTLRVIGAWKKKCNPDMCYFATHYRGNMTGTMCGVYSNLGNPIICGKGADERIEYISWAVGWERYPDPFPRFKNCSSGFRAVKVANFAEQLLKEYTRRTKGPLVCEKAKLS